MGARAPAVILGCSPFVASRQFAERARSYEARFSGRPEAVGAVWSAFADGGGRAIHLVDDPGLIEAFDLWRGSRTGAGRACAARPPASPRKESERSAQRAKPAELRRGLDVWLTVAGPDFEEKCRWLRSAGGSRVFRHATQVDGGEDLTRFFAVAREHGLEPGAATHAPGRATEPGAALDPRCELLVPFNALGYAMDITPRSLLERTRARPGPTHAMMALAAGRLPWPSGVAYAALHFGTSLVGTGDVRHAREIAGAEAALAALSSSDTFVQTEDRRTDAGEAQGEVLLIRDHRALRLGREAAELWARLAEPTRLSDLVRWAAGESGRSGPELESEVAACLLVLLKFGAVEGRPAP